MKFYIFFRSNFILYRFAIFYSVYVLVIIICVLIKFSKSSFAWFLLICYSPVYSKCAIGFILKSFNICNVSIERFFGMSSISPVLIYLSSTSYENPSFSSSVFPHKPSVGTFTTRRSGSPSSLPIAFTSVFVSDSSGEKSLLHLHILYCNQHSSQTNYMYLQHARQSTEKLHTALPFSL